jgi:hypothetical protein
MTATTYHNARRLRWSIAFATTCGMKPSKQWREEMTLNDEDNKSLSVYEAVACESSIDASDCVAGLRPKKTTKLVVSSETCERWSCVPRVRASALGEEVPVVQIVELEGHTVEPASAASDYFEAALSISRAGSFRPRRACREPRETKMKRCTSMRRLSPLQESCSRCSGYCRTADVSVLQRTGPFPGEPGR